MAQWLIRTGKHGKFEKKVLDGNRVYLTWNERDARDLPLLQNIGPCPPPRRCPYHMPIARSVSSPETTARRFGLSGVA